MSSEVAMDNVFGLASTIDTQAGGDGAEFLNGHKASAPPQQQQTQHLVDTDDLMGDGLMMSADDAASLMTLNPAAKEFVPGFGAPAVVMSPTPPSTGNGNLFLLDDVVAQSPRKATPMEGIDMPTEIEFDQEISSRPHEVEAANDFILSNGGGLNPKEAAQGDEKTEEDYLIESSKAVDEVEFAAEPVPQLLSFDRFDQPAAMQESFYEEKTSEELNKVQVLPVADEVSGNGWKDSNDRDASPDVQNVTFELNPFDQPTIYEEEPAAGPELFEVSRQVASEISNLLIEAQSVTQEILEQQKVEKDEETAQQPHPVEIEVNQFEQFERAMNEENQRLSTVLETAESSVDQEPQIASAPSQPIEFDESIIDLTNSVQQTLAEASPEPIVETIQQFMVSPEPSPATITIPETPVLESQPIVEEQEEPSPQEEQPNITIEDSVVVDESPLPTPQEEEKPIAEKSQLIESIPDVIPKAAATATAVAATVAAVVAVTQTKTELESKKKAAAAAVESKSSPTGAKKSATAPSSKTSSAKPATAAKTTSSAITSKSAPISRPKTTQAPAQQPAAKTSPITKRAVPSTTAPPQQKAAAPRLTTARPTTTRPTSAAAAAPKTAATASSRPGTATSRVTTTSR